MSEADDGAEWLREIAREEIDAASIRPEHVRLGAKVLGTAGVGLTALQLGAVGRVAAQETGPGAGTIGTEGSPLDAIYADTIDRDRDIIKPDELSILSKRFGLDDTVPLGTNHARVTSDALEFSPDGSSWVAGQAERYDGSAWNDAQVERYDGNSWRQIYPETAIPTSAVAHFNAQDLSGFSDGETVGTWPDQVNSNDASANGSPVYRPSAINGNAAIELSGSGQWYDAPIGTHSQRTVVFAVVELDSDATLSDSHGVFDGQSSRQHVWWRGAGNWGMFAGSTIDGSSDDSTQLFVADFDSTTELREDGSETASGDAGTNDLDDFRMGANSSGGSEFDGYVGFYEVHDGAPSNGLQTREQEIADMWGITL